MHVRGTTREIQALIANLAEQSPTFRAMLDRLEHSTVIIYVRAAPLPSAILEGRLGFLTSNRAQPGARLLVIELACRRPLNAQAVTLAHELRHAVEVADAPWVVSPGTLAQYYTQIGMRVPATGGGSAFETLAAREAASRVQRELIVAARTARTTGTR